MRLTIAIIIFAIVAVESVYSASSSSTLSSSSSTNIATSVIRLKANKLRRPESCRENLPRKSEDLPILVITGRVKEVYIAGESPSTITSQTNITTSSLNLGSDQQLTATTTTTTTSTNGKSQSSSSNNKALVTIVRVIKGNQQLLGSDIIISGFNSSSSSPCPNYVKPNDSYILLLNQEADRKYSIQNNNILSLNLYNLDRVNAIAADEPFKRRPPIEDILCEAHYCAYGRCVVDEKTNRTSCHCPDTCSPLPAPVCGSDSVTYPNECHLIQEGCRRQKPLFVTKEASC